MLWRWRFARRVTVVGAVVPSRLAAASDSPLRPSHATVNCTLVKHERPARPQGYAWLAGLSGPRADGGTTGPGPASGRSDGAGGAEGTAGCAFIRASARTFLSITSAFRRKSSSGRFLFRETRSQQRDKNSRLISCSASNASRYLSTLGPIRP